MLKITKHEISAIANDLHKECNRLLRTGAVSDSTKKATIYRVALENLSERCILDIDDYQNLRRF